MTNYRKTSAAQGKLAFSRVSPQILYYSTGGTTLHRYNTATNALADASPFPISWTTDSTPDMWLQVNQNDTRATAINATENGVTSVDLSTGTVTNMATQHLDEIYIGYTTYALINDDKGGSGATAAYIWDITANTAVSAGLPYGQMTEISHAPSMNGYWIGVDTNKGAGHMPLNQVFYNGTHASPASTNGDNLGGSLYYGQFHISGHWTQAAGNDQWLLFSMDESPTTGWSAYAQYANMFVNVGTGIGYTLNYHYSDTTLASYYCPDSPDSPCYWSQAHTSISGTMARLSSLQFKHADAGFDRPRRRSLLVEVPTH